MNTDDLVWLAEEAYKPSGMPSAAAERRGSVPVEQAGLGVCLFSSMPCSSFDECDARSAATDACCC